MATKKQYFKERNRSLCKRCSDILVFLRCKRSTDILCKRCSDIYQLVINQYVTFNFIYYFSVIIVITCKTAKYKDNRIE